MICSASGRCASVKLSGVSWAKRGGLSAMVFLEVKGE
jgi:hypothetical protein